MTPAGIEAWLEDLNPELFQWVDPPESAVIEEHNDGSQARVEVRVPDDSRILLMKLDHHLHIKLLQGTKNADGTLLIERAGEWICIVAEIKVLTKWKANKFHDAWEQLQQGYRRARLVWRYLGLESVRCEAWLVHQHDRADRDPVEGKAILDGRLPTLDPVATLWEQFRRGAAVGPFESSRLIKLDPTKTPRSAVVELDELAR